MSDTTQNQAQPTMRKELSGTNEDGTPHYRYYFEGPEGGGVVRTGPISGTVALKDGTVYDLSEDYVAHHPGHAGPLAHHIGMLHERAGRLQALDADGNPIPFRHTCDDFCGDEAIPERLQDASGSVQA
jgi:hypothetical protein